MNLIQEYQEYKSANVPCRFCVICALYIYIHLILKKPSKSNIQKKGVELKAIKIRLPLYETCT